MKNFELPDDQRVVITGYGCVSPLGLNAETSFSRLIAGESGIVELSDELAQYSYATNYGVQAMAVVPEFTRDFFLESTGIQAKKIKSFHKSNRFGLVAAQQAMLMAGLTAPGSIKLLSDFNPDRVGATISSGIGGGDAVGDMTARIVDGKDIPPSTSMNVFPERVASVLSMEAGLMGPIHCSSAACATGNDAIIDAYRKVRLGEGIFLAGGTEAQVTIQGLAMFAGLTALDKSRYFEASRPFNSRENGFVMGEGAAVFVIESLKSATERGVDIIAEIVGFGDTADADDPTMLNEAGSKKALAKAIEDIDMTARVYVNAHATGTGGDKSELNVIRQVVHPENLKAISSTKGASGHMLGAAGAFEALVCVKVLETGIIPATLKLDDPVVEAQGLPVIANHAVEQQVDVAVNNSFGFGGLNKVLAFAKFRP